LLRFDPLTILLQDFSQNSLIKKCWYHDTDGHEIGDCVAFKQLDLKSKFDVLRKNGGCYYKEVKNVKNIFFGNV
jgi:hypothetical protein